ncbi:M48 family metalloprotease [Chitinimonas sp.]|uniref:M48 family metalloprotease n=1 Tax=Chitinimonas sp. TaxID=1934313 RepID=UPI0035B115A7
MNKLQKWLSLVALALAVDVQAFDLGNLQKALEIGKKAVDANKEIGEAEEVEIGAGIASNLLGAAPLVKDAELQRYVNRIGTWLASQTERSGLKWHFAVIDSPNINAFAMPGGYIFITKGLFDRLRNESELAGVLAHEISHTLQKHHLKAIQGGMGREALGDLAQAVADKKGSRDSQLLSKAFKAGTELYARGLDKGDEFEADRMGVVIAARGGYSPYGLVGVLQTLGEIPTDGAFALMFKTHPTPSARLDELGAAMGDRFDGLEKTVDDVPRFAKMKH